MCDGKFISFQLYWFIKGLIFDILDDFQYFHGLTQLSQQIENIYHHCYFDLLFVFCFSSNKEYLYTNHDLDFYDICNTFH